MINQPTTDESVTEFLTKLTSPFDADAAYFNSLYDALTVFPSASMAHMEKKGKGTFGEFYICKVDGSRCYKIINTATQLFNVFKELFIQQFLTQSSTGRKHVPAIRGVFKKIQGGNKFIVVEMDRADMSLFELLDNMASGGQQIKFPDFYKITKSLFMLLKYFNDTYRFVHRDFKTNNIMLKRTPDGGYTIYIIDFGSSCISLNVNGTDYTIKALGAYRPEVPCLVQQDVSVFLMDLKIHFGDLNMLNPDVMAFINSMLIPKYHAYIGARVATPDKMYTGHPFWAAYNLYGNMFTNPAYVDLEEALDVNRLLAMLDAKATQLGVPLFGGGAGPAGGGGGGAAGGQAGGAAYGGRRRTRYKKRKTNRRRR